MATRIRTQSSGAVAVTPATWTFATQINPVTVPGTLTLNTGSTMTSKTETISIISPHLDAFGRTIIGPLEAQTISGTVRGQMRGQESIAGANAMPALAVKLVRSDGVDRGVLLAPVGSDSAATGSEFVLALTNSIFKDLAESVTLALTTQTAQRGDYLVIEWGVRTQQTTAARTVTLSYGNNSATDLTLGDTTVTAANNPWWEFSQDLVFFSATEDPTLLNYAHPFVAAETVLIPESLHACGTAALLTQVLDTTQTPAEVIEPSTLTIHPTTHEVSVTFLQPQTGLVLLQGATPNAAATRNYRQSFSATETVTIAAAAHGFTTGRLLVRVYDASSPPRRIQPSTMTVDQSTYAVVCTFLQPQSGFVVVCGGAATGTTLNASVAFTAQETVTVSESTHQRGTDALLVELYTAATPAARLQPDRLTVGPSPTFTTTATFLQPQSGVMVLNGSFRTVTLLLTAAPAGSSHTPASSTATLRSLTAHVAGGSLTPASTATQGRLLTGSAVSQSHTPLAASAILRPLLAVAGAQSQTIAASAVLTALVSFAARPSGTSATPGVMLQTVRPVLAAVRGTSTAPDSASGLIRVVEGRVTCQSATPGLLMTTLRQVMVTVQTPSQTASSVTTAVRRLAGQSVASSQTAAAARSLGQSLTAALGGHSQTPFVEMTQQRQISAAVGSQSVTPASSRGLIRGMVTAIAGQSRTSSLALSALTVPNVGILFGPATNVSISEAQHGIGHAAMVIQVYNTSVSPARMIEPNTLAVDPVSHTVELIFLQAQTGLVVLNGAAPPSLDLLGTAQKAFTSTEVVSVSAAEHGFATSALLVVTYDTTSAVWEALRPDRITVDQSTYAVTVTFAQPQTGVVLVCAAAASGGTPNVSVGFTGQTSVTVAESTHGLGTPLLLAAVYDAGSPLRRLIRPNRIALVPDATHALTVEFLQPQSGTLVLNGSQQQALVAMQAASRGASQTSVASVTVLRELVSRVASQSQTPLAVLSDATLANYAFPFVASADVTVPQALHQATTTALLVQVLDTTVTPAQVIEPGSVTVAANGDVRVQFLALTTGIILVNGASPSVASRANYTEAFSGVAQVTVTQAAHGFDHGALLVAVYDTTIEPPRLLTSPGSITVGQAAPYPVEVRFLDAQTGVIVICGASAGGTANYSAPFNTNQVIVEGTTHGRGTAQLLVGLYDTSTPALRMLPDLVTVDPTTLRVTVTFLGTQQGTIVIGGSSRSVVLPLAAGVSGQSRTPALAVQTMRLLTQALASQSVTPVSGITTVRLLLSQGTAQSQTPAVPVQHGRSLPSLVLASSRTSVGESLTLRALLAACGGLSSAPPAPVTTERLLTAQVGGQSQSPVSAAVNEHLLTARLAGQSQTAPATSAVATLRLLTSALVAQSHTPSRPLVQTRQLLSQVAGSSQSSRSLVLLQRSLAPMVQSVSETTALTPTTIRLLPGYLSGESQASAPTVVLTALREFAAHVQAASDTSLPLVTTERFLPGIVLGWSFTAIPAATTGRPLVGQSVGASTTAEALATMGTLRLMSSWVAAQSQTPPLATVRTVRLVSGLSRAASGTPAATASVLRPLLARATSASSTPASLRLLTRAVVSSLAGQSRTRPSTSTQVRRLQSATVGTSGIPVATAFVTALRALVLQSGGVSATPAITASVDRTLMGRPQARTLTPVLATTHLRHLSTALTSESRSSLPEVRTVRLVLSAGAAHSRTPSVALTGQRLFASLIYGASQVAEVQGLQERALVSQAQSASRTQDAAAQVTRALLHRSGGQSLIPEQALLVRLHALAATVQGTSQEGVDPLLVLLVRALRAEVTATSRLPSSVVTHLRLLAATLATPSQTPAVLQIPFSGLFVLESRMTGQSRTAAASAIEIPRLRLFVVADEDRRTTAQDDRVWVLTGTDVS